MTIYKSNTDNGIPLKSLGTYVPWGTHRSMGGVSANYDPYSKDILDFKDNKPAAIKKFADLISPLLLNNFAVCVVPSHNPNKTTGSLYQLANSLSGRLGSLNASGCLVRHTKIEKLAKGGNRSISTHLKSIRVDQQILIQNKNILLIDDVVTSGNSIQACKQLLLEAGAKQVWCLSLGKTT